MRRQFRPSVLLTSGVFLLVILSMLFASCAANSKISGKAGQAEENRWVSIAAGKGHSLAVKSNGTLWAWGGNEVGQLGDGTLKMRNSPVQIGRINF